MKNRFFLLCIITALMGCAVIFNYSPLWAQEDEEPAMPFDSTKAPIAAEFSNLPDREDSLGPWWGLNGLDPLQVLCTDLSDLQGPLYPKDGLDYGPSGACDALANHRDAYVSKLTCADSISSASLVFSMVGDPVVIAGKRVAVHIETPAGVIGPTYTQLNFVNTDTIAARMDDLDGLQLWGTLTCNSSDRFSQQGDPGGFSVWTSAGVGYVPQGDVAAAVVALGYVGLTDLVDLDALLVRDWGTVGTWDSPDTIVFSIRNTIPGGGTWNGGEIVVLPWNALPGSTARILRHGRHWWTTGWADSNLVPLFGTTDVDAIETFPYDFPKTPTLTQWGLIILVALLITSTVFVLLKRRKAAMPA